MNRRSLLKTLAALPLMGWLKPFVPMDIVEVVHVNETLTCDPYYALSPELSNLWRAMNAQVGKTANDEWNSSHYLWPRNERMPPGFREHISFSELRQKYMRKDFGAYTLIERITSEPPIG